MKIKSNVSVAFSRKFNCIESSFVHLVVLNWKVKLVTWFKNSKVQDLSNDQKAGSKIKALEPLVNLNNIQEKPKTTIKLLYHKLRKTIHSKTKLLEHSYVLWGTQQQRDVTGEFLLLGLISSKAPLFTGLIASFFYYMPKVNEPILKSSNFSVLL